MRPHCTQGRLLPLGPLQYSRRAFSTSSAIRTGEVGGRPPYPRLLCLYGVATAISPATITATALQSQGRGCATQSGGGPADIPKTKREVPPIIDTPPPPRPAFYVPPEERDPDDESLAFMKGGSPLQHLRTSQRAARPERTQAGAAGVDAVNVFQGEGSGADVSVRLTEGQEVAPHLDDCPLRQRVFMDEDSARLQSTSVHAGHSLLKDGPTLDTSDYYSSAHNRSSVRSGGVRGSAGADRGPEASDVGEGVREGETPASSRSEQKAPFRGSMFSAKYADVEMEDVGVDTTSGLVAASRAKMTTTQQMEVDIQKLEYYHGTPQYPALLKAFKEKYGSDDDSTNPDARRSVVREYTDDEKERGLADQPIDYLRSSQKLQSQLMSGPHAYDPITVLQRTGVLRHQGYAFPPTVELGKLKDSSDVAALQAAHKRTGAIASVRRSFNALMGRPDFRDSYLAEAEKPAEDKHLVYRVVGLDAVQRRQMRFMLTDFDYQDRSTSFHVMMSYPYTDWIHVFYMVLVGWALYQLQVRYGAYEFYDEYLGLDLRQVPSLKKPMLACTTVITMVFFLFTPLLIASIATTRAYRIFMRRPIGPP